MARRRTRDVMGVTRRSLISGAGSLLALAALPWTRPKAQEAVVGSGVFGGTSNPNAINLVFSGGSLPGAVSVVRESHGTYLNSSGVVALASANTGRITYGQNGGASGGGSLACRGLMCEPYAASFLSNPGSSLSGWTKTHVTTATLNGPDGGGISANSALSIVCNSSSGAVSLSGGPVSLYAGAVNGYTFTVAATVRMHSGAAAGTYVMLGFSNSTTVGGANYQAFAIFDLGLGGGTPGTCYSSASATSNYGLVVNGCGAQQLTAGAASGAWWRVWMNFTVPASGAGTNWYWFLQPWGSSSFANSFSTGAPANGSGIDVWDQIIEYQPNGPGVATPSLAANSAPGVSVPGSHFVFNADYVAAGGISSVAEQYACHPIGPSGGSGYIYGASNFLTTATDASVWYGSVTSGGALQGGTFPIHAGAVVGGTGSSLNSMTAVALTPGPADQSSYGAGGTIGITAGYQQLARTPDFVSFNVPAGTAGLLYTFDDGTTATLPVLPVYANLAAAGYTVTGTFAGVSGAPAAGPPAQMQGASGKNYYVPTNLASGRAIASIVSTGAPAGVPNVLIDTDCSGDDDDYAALYAALFFATQGAINLIGVTQDVSDMYSAPAIYAALYANGFGHVPVGSYWQSGANFTGTIASGVLTLATNATGTIAANQALTGAGVGAAVYINALTSGTAGQAGATYSLTGSPGTVSTAEAMSTSPGLTGNWPNASSDGTDLTSTAAPLQSGLTASKWYTKAIAQAHPGILAGYTNWNAGVQGSVNPMRPGWQVMLDCCLAAPDHSVSLVMIGLWSNLSNAILYTGNYRNSGYNGAQILAKKLKALYVLGGAYNINGTYASNALNIIQNYNNLYATLSNVFNGNTAPGFAAAGVNIYQANFNFYGSSKPGTLWFNQNTPFDPSFNLQNIAYFIYGSGTRAAWDPSAVMMAIPALAPLILLKDFLPGNNGLSSGGWINPALGYTVALGANPYAGNAYYSGENAQALASLTGVMANGSTTLTVSGWTSASGPVVGASIAGQNVSANVGLPLAIGATAIGTVVSQITPLQSGETYGGNGRYTMSAAAGSALSGALTIPAVAGTASMSNTTTLTVSALTAGNIGPGAALSIGGSSVGTVVSQATGTVGGVGTYVMSGSYTASGALTGTSSVSAGQVTNTLTSLLYAALKGLW